MKKNIWKPAGIIALAAAIGFGLVLAGCQLNMMGTTKGVTVTIKNSYTSPVISVSLSGETHSGDDGTIRVGDSKEFTYDMSGTASIYPFYITVTTQDRKTATHKGDTARPGRTFDLELTLDGEELVLEYIPE
jgi:hypothetical protein